MAVTYGFYNSLNKDRMYNAEQMSSIFNGIITDGVFSTIGDALMTVAGTGMQVIVKTGRAWFNSTWTLNDAQLPLDVPTADVSLTRIDAVILEVNSAVATRANSIKILKGTPSANPAKPTLSATETLHQYALAYITVAAGVTSITAANIEVNVGKTSCPFITSVLQQTDITDLFNQWEAEFTAWFENVQSQLSGDIAANLQRQIDLKVNLSDKATNDEAIAGVSDTKWITPAKLKKVRDEIEQIGDVKLTTKNSLGDDWLLCDGSNIDLSAYPEYKEIIESTASPNSGWAKTTNINTNMTQSHTCAHGSYIVEYDIRTGGTDDDYFVLSFNIFDINTNSMKTVTVPDVLGDGNGDMTGFTQVGLTYQNGCWIFVAFDKNVIYTVISKDDLVTFSLKKFNLANGGATHLATWDANESYFVFGGCWTTSNEWYTSWYIYGDISNPESITWTYKVTAHNSKYAYPIRKIELFQGSRMYIRCNYTGSSSYSYYMTMLVGDDYNPSNPSRYGKDVSVTKTYGTPDWLYQYLSTGLFGYGKTTDVSNVSISLPSGFTYADQIDLGRESKNYMYLIGTIGNDTVIVKVSGTTAEIYCRVASSLVSVNDFCEMGSNKWFLIGKMTNYGAYRPNINIDGCNAFLKVK